MTKTVRARYTLEFKQDEPHRVSRRPVGLSQTGVV